MLNKNPRERPSVKEIMALPLVKAKVREILLEASTLEQKLEEEAMCTAGGNCENDAEKWE